jgi:hypothetical protein
MMMKVNKRKELKKLYFRLILLILLQLECNLRCALPTHLVILLALHQKERMSCIFLLTLLRINSSCVASEYAHPVYSTISSHF